MSHFFGPTWMAKDGSFVVAHNAVPYPVAGTIPWLRLQAKSTGAGPYGDKLADDDLHPAHQHHRRRRPGRGDLQRDHRGHPGRGRPTPPTTCFYRAK